MHSVRIGQNVEKEGGLSSLFYCLSTRPSEQANEDNEAQQKRGIWVCKYTHTHTFVCVQSAVWIRWAWRSTNISHPHLLGFANW